MDCLAASSSFTSCIMKLMRKAKDVALFVHDLKVFRETALDRWMFDASTGTLEAFPSGMVTEAMRGLTLMEPPIQ